MSRLNKIRQNELQPKRIQFALNEINKLGFEIILVVDSRIDFYYKESLISFFPYSGWHTGKNIIDGRGWKKLRKQLIT